jgi:hypothetical protein
LLDYVGTGKAFMFAPDGSWIAFANREGDEYEVLVRSGLDETETEHRFTVPGEPYILKFTWGSDYLAIGHRCPPYVTIIDCSTWEPVTTAFTLEYGICSLDFSRDDAYLAVVYAAFPNSDVIKTADWTNFEVSYLEDETP